MDAMDASRYSEGLPRVEVDRRDWEFVRRDVLSDPFSIFFPHGFGVRDWDRSPDF